MLKVGLVGIGGMGFVHYNAYKKIEGAEVVAVADVRTDACGCIIVSTVQRVKKEFGLQS